MNISLALRRLATRGTDLDAHDFRRILTITGPAMLELVLSQLFGMVDTIMLGRSRVSTVGIASVGLTHNPINLLLGIMSAFNVGTTAAIAWAIGRRDRAEARALARTAMGLNLLLGAVATLLGYLPAPVILRFMGAQADTYGYALAYLRIVSLGFLPSALNMGVTGCLRAAGLTRLPMVYNLAANLLNVVGNWALIFGHLGFAPMDVTGAAISTTFSRVVGALAALVALYGMESPVRLRLRQGVALRLRDMKRILSVGLTTAAEQALMQVGFMFFARTVSALGTVVFAAHQVCLNINGLSWVPAQAFGVASTTLVGQHMGAGEPGKARHCARVILRGALTSSLLVGCVFLLWSQSFVRLYDTNADVVRAGASALRIMALGMAGIGTQMAVAAALRGAGDARFPLLASCAGIWVFRVALAPVFVHTLGWGLNGAWLCIVLDQSLRALVVYARFRHGGWMRRAAPPS
ncbi:MAG: MATE family efflux transporter [Oscillospiraceae bacterium]|jgi:putative MATE family efflux protein|nr:MATE family efflux transporter [Oscillospiraceae bacterium]